MIDDNGESVGKVLTERLELASGLRKIYLYDEGMLIETRSVANKDSGGPQGARQENRRQPGVKV